MPDPNSIRIKRSNTSTNVPSSLLNGELAANSSDQKLWIGNSSNTPILLSDFTNTFVNQGAWDYNATYNKNTVVTYASIFYYSISAVPPYSTQPNVNPTYWSVLSNPDETVSLTQGTDISITGTYPNLTIGYSGTPGGVTSVTAGTGISVDKTTGAITVSSTITQYADSDARASLSSTATGLTYTSATGVLSLTASYAIPTTTSQTNWDSAYNERLQWNGGSTNLVAATGRTSLGATTVGENLLTLVNPSAITFPQFNANNTVTALSAASFRTAIGAGTSSASGTVTSIATTSPITGGTITGTGTIGINASSLNTASFVVQRDVSGNFAAGTITATLTGNATNVTGIVAIANGGTGQVTANAAVNALLPSQTSNSGKYLTTDGTNSSWGTVSTGTTIPSASMQMFAGAITQSASAGVVTTTAPTGWLLCNGDAVSRSTYSALWTALGTTSSPYGQGDNSTTFNLPDLRSRVPIGVGTGSGLTARTLGGTVGEESTTVQQTNLPTHSHTFSPTGTLNTESGHVHSSPDAGSHGHSSNNYFLLYVGSGGGASLNNGSSYQIYNLNATIQANGSHSHGNTNGNSGHTHTFTPTAGQTTGNGPGTGATLTNMQPSIGMNYIIKT